MSLVRPIMLWPVEVREVSPGVATLNRVIQQGDAQNGYSWTVNLRREVVAACELPPEAVGAAQLPDAAPRPQAPPPSSGTAATARDASTSRAASTARDGTGEGPVRAQADAPRPYAHYTDAQLAAAIERTNQEIGMRTSNALKLGLGVGLSVVACIGGPPPVKVVGALGFAIFGFGVINNLWLGRRATQRLSALLTEQATRRVEGTEGLRVAAVPVGIKPTIVPDPDYQVVPQPVPRQVFARPISPGGGVTPQLADAANALAETLGRLAGLDEARLTALDRAQTAYDAGDSTWFWRQTEAARTYALQSVPLLKGLQAQFDALRVALAAGGAATSVTAANVQAMQRSLAMDGFPPALVDPAARLGLTGADLATLQARVVAADPNDVVGQSGGSLHAMLTPSGLASTFQIQADLEDQFARPVPNAGVGVAPGATRGVLQATITARDAICSPDNQLRSVRFTRLDNATVDVPGVGTISAPAAAAIPLPGGPPSVVLTLRRIQEGRPSTAAVVITDGCGDWPTFIGGGPNAF